MKSDAALRKDPKIREYYGRLLDRYPNHPVVMDVMDGRILRWKRNEAVRLLVDSGDLNKLWIDFMHGSFNIEDMATLYRMMGYSLYGFLDVFDDRLSWRRKP